MCVCVCVCGCVCVCVCVCVFVCVFGVCLQSTLQCLNGRILGSVFDGGNWRRRYNDELMAMYGELDIVSIIRLRRLRWIGHVGRKVCPTSNLLSTRSEKKRGKTKDQMVGFCTGGYKKVWNKGMDTASEG